MSKKKMLTSTTLGLALLIVTGCAGGAEESSGTPAAAAECGDTTLEYATYANANSDQAKAAAWWAEEVEERSDGAISVNLHTSGSLIGAEDALAALRDGRADMAQVAGIYYPSDLSVMSVAELPFQTRNAEAHMKAVAALAEENEDFKQQLTANNITYVFPIPFDAAVIGSNEAIESTEDLQGMNVRSAGVHNDAFTAAGANPVALAATEIYEAFSRGVVDGWSGLGMVNSTSFGLAEDTPYMTDTGIGLSSVSAAAMSTETFENLCSEHQEIVMEVGKEAADTGVELLNEASEEACEVLKTNDTEFHVWDEELTNEWAGQVKSAETWVESHSGEFDSKAVLDEFQTLVSEFEEESDFTPPMHTCAESN